MNSMFFSDVKCHPGILLAGFLFDLLFSAFGNCIKSAALTFFLSTMIKDQLIRDYRSKSILLKIASDTRTFYHFEPLLDFYLTSHDFF